jgi:hypothetical protein
VLRVAIVAVAVGASTLTGLLASGSAASARQATAPPPHKHSFPIRHCSTSYSHSHHDYPATDIFAARGCHFVSPVRGVVDEIGRRDHWDPSTDKGSQRGGRFVSVVGVDGVRYYGSHLDHVNRRIHPGDHVDRGQILGRVGNSGNARGIATHLHFGISWPTRDDIWWVRRGEVWPWRYLEAWQAGDHRRCPHDRVVAKRDRVGRVPACDVDC